MHKVNLDDESAIIAMLQSASASSEEKQQAGEKIYVAYLDFLKNLARSWGSPEEDAEDFAHDVLILVIYTKVHLFVPYFKGSFKYWLTRVARNLFYNQRKKALRMVFLQELWGEEESTTESTEKWHEYAKKYPDFLPEYQRRTSNSLREMEEIADIEQDLDLAGLTELEKQVFRFTIYWNSKPKEIALMIPGQSPKNISRILYNAKAKLKNIRA